MQLEYMKELKMNKIKNGGRNTAFLFCLEKSIVLKNKYYVYSKKEKIFVVKNKVIIQT